MSERPMRLFSLSVIFGGRGCFFVFEVTFLPLLFFKQISWLCFNVDVVYENLKNEIRYQVVIDNPSAEITDIRALAIHDKQTDDVFPSVGIFDEKLNLIPNEKPSGVILVGYIPFEGDYEKFTCEMKVLISYKIGEEKYESYYVTKK